MRRAMHVINNFPLHELSHSAAPESQAPIVACLKCSVPVMAWSPSHLYGFLPHRRAALVLIGCSGWVILREALGCARISTQEALFRGLN